MRERHGERNIRKDSVSFEDNNGVLCCPHRKEETLIQVTLSESLRSRVNSIAHVRSLAGHRGQRRMSRRLSRSKFWPQMSGGFKATVKKCTSCANNRALIIKTPRYMRLFPATEPLKSVDADILGLLPKRK